MFVLNKHTGSNVAECVSKRSPICIYLFFYVTEIRLRIVSAKILVVY